MNSTATKDCKQRNKRIKGGKRRVEEMAEEKEVAVE